MLANHYHFVCCMCSLAIICVLPSLNGDLSRNPVIRNQVNLLHDNNIESNTTEDCEYLYIAVQSWLYASATIQARFEVVDDGVSDAHLLWAQLLPVRCIWQRNDGIITTSDFCGTSSFSSISSICGFWDETNVPNPSKQYFANSLDARPGGIVDIVRSAIFPVSFLQNETQVEFYVRAIYNESHPIALA
jgi:hypothetical protein